MRRNRQRGAATLEALVLLPFFFIVWGGLFFTYRLLERKVVVDEAARGCTWATMSGGCVEPRSPRCAYVAGPQLSDDDLEGSLAALDNIAERLPRFLIDFRGRFGPVFRALFGAELDAAVARPRMLGSGALVVRTAFSAMCNEVPGDATVPAMTRDSFCGMSGWCD